jgi:hypothetical protein
MRFVVGEVAPELVFPRDDLFSSANHYFAIVPYSFITAPSSPTHAPHEVLEMGASSLTRHLGDYRVSKFEFYKDIKVMKLQTICGIVKVISKIKLLKIGPTKQSIIFCNTFWKVTENNRSEAAEICSLRSVATIQQTCLPTIDSKNRTISVSAIAIPCDTCFTRKILHKKLWGPE